MNPRVKNVYPLQGYKLKIEFVNNETRLFDMSPYLKIGVFKELQNEKIFNTVAESLGSVVWKNGQDLCPDTLYLDSVPL